MTSDSRAPRGESGRICFRWCSCPLCLSMREGGCLGPALCRALWCMGRPLRPRFCVHVTEVSLWCVLGGTCWPFDFLCSEPHEHHYQAQIPLFIPSFFVFLGRSQPLLPDALVEHRPFLGCGLNTGIQGKVHVPVLIISKSWHSLGLLNLKPAQKCC